VTESTFDPESIGISRAKVSDLIGGDAIANAETARLVLDPNSSLTGEQRAILDIVALNAAAGIAAYELSKALDDFDLQDQLSKAFAVATAAVEDGRAIAKLNEWVSATQNTGE
jgi:anthranilate phosphoribosyltransferase